MTEVNPAPTALEQKRQEKIETSVKKEQVLDTQIPTPVGYRILIALPNIEETYGASGIVKSQKAIRDEYILSMIGCVLELGDEAYKDKARFTNGPWCKRGDFVMFRANSGTRFNVGGQEYRLLNDDSIEAVVADPSKIARA